MGSEQEYLVKGVDGYVSFVGHRDSSYQRGNQQGHYLDKEPSSIWLKEAGEYWMRGTSDDMPS